MRVLNLIVQAAKHATGGSGVIVLNEFDARLNEFCKFSSIEALEEESASIAEYLRFDNLDFRQSGSSYLDGHAT
ncbi:hypothetical protein X963_3625 [Burkholderia pseudomallei MSHR7498]|nr:hypothetical protein BURPS668_3104 [Burkholderia pseudomallei 668]EEP88724.1 conserved hypothetical protein [Burkholderia mallei GB8 horse 4]KGS94603.1 hypothetical protein X963_3625 [Burkholderia pseudomallei MSHR7498]KGX71053.1 hypothetical protein Y026_3135 [Burkholderia pseudomallei TSV28]KOS74524.1 hypothetical protein DM46_213 [Burkholderia mallei]